MRHIALLLMLTLAVAGEACAQSMAGVWQGTAGQIRNVLWITQDPAGDLHGELYILDTGDVGLHPLSAIAVSGKKVSVALASLPSRFEGTLTPDGKKLAGTWYAGDKRNEDVTFERATKKTAWPIDAAKHATRFLAVDKDVFVEVLDWGGKGPPMVFLPGLGNTAHVFDSFAPKFTDKYHVYGITRRGYGASSWPAPTDENYDPYRLANDVLAVIEALQLRNPVLVGHSIAGQELSSIGTRVPERVAALVYLDAAMDYAFYNPAKVKNTLGMDAAIVRRHLQELPLADSARAQVIINELQAALPHLQRSMQSFPDIRAGSGGGQTALPRTAQEKINSAIVSNQRPFMEIKAPVLAIYAMAPCEAICASPREQALAASKREQIEAVEAGMPLARVVRIPNADHYVFRSNEADVLREINAFLGGLKP
jgi:pimeloyl-ACP methyl ester carboxylesterase